MEHNLFKVDAFRSYKDLRQDINNMKIWLLFQNLIYQEFSMEKGLQLKQKN